MSVSLTKKTSVLTDVEEIYPQRQDIPQILEPKITEAENAPAVKKSKEAVRPVFENIKTNDLTALEDNELRGLTLGVQKIIQKNYDLFLRVCAEGERRSEQSADWSPAFYDLDYEFWGGVGGRIAEGKKKYDKKQRSRKWIKILYYVGIPLIVGSVYFWLMLAWLLA